MPSAEPRRRPPLKRRQRIVLALALVGITGALAAIFWARAQPLPIAALTPHTVASQRLYDRRGVLLREILARPDGRAHWVDLEAISPHLVAATIASEDQRFYEHRGVDLLAATRALFSNLRRRRIVSGASTLTMQLARLLHPERRSFVAKARQVALALKLEGLLDKRQILSQYLNRAPYGAGCFGAEAASRRYFDKPAASLSLAEAALLAALPRSPSGYNPLRPRSLRRLRRRQRYILGAMRAQRRISAEQLRIALAEPLHLERLARPFLAPHFVDRLVSIGATKGYDRLRTTLDLELQTQVETVVVRTLRGLEAQGVSNAAVMVVDNASGDILAHVGSRSFRGEAGQVDGAAALRQPGSAIKPFAYALALEQGMTPATVLRDLPAHFATPHGDYAPRNYDGRFRGPVRARVALASSLNIPAVRVAEFVGATRLLDGLRRLGFSALTRDAQHYGLGLALGNGEVTLEELVAAYASLARGGVHRPLRSLISRGSPGAERLEALPRGKAKRVLSAEATHQVTAALADPIARMPTFGRYGPLETPFFAAVKTGTSKDFRDNWCVGFTRHLTVGVWVGNFDGSSMHNVSGVTGAAPLWREVITTAVRHLGHPDDPPKRPKSLVEIAVCPLSGALPGSACPSHTREIFRPERQPRERCRYHRHVAIERQSGLLAGGRCPPSAVERRLYVLYPAPYKAWASAQGIPRPPQTYAPRCPGPETRPPADAAARPRIRFPSAGDVYYLDADLRRRFQTMPLEVDVAHSPARVEWLVDDKVIARPGYPYSARWRLRAGVHQVTVRLPSGVTSAPVRIEVR